MAVRASAPMEADWPTGGLECVARCPVCAWPGRTLLHQGLVDQVFFAAPGEWCLWRCDQCRSAYLDPRPNQATIGLAYSKYYTHDEAIAPPPITRFQRLRASLGNGYRNHRYGTGLTPAMPLGRVIAILLPPLAKPADFAYRFLPRPMRGQQRRVLDIGCGNGAWLCLARDAGCQVAGVEPDPVSRRLARERGIEVFDSMSAWLSQPASFDYITMSHVIEHVHEPGHLLSDAFQLLRPGGGIFVETPNIDALGHQLYGRYWRGLEPPRHLVLFNRGSLRRALLDAGFQDIRWRPRPSPYRDMALQSRRMAAGLDPLSDQDMLKSQRVPDAIPRLATLFKRDASEFITLTASKPHE